jgi:branched-chain amino acid transport system permease protein
VFDFLISSVTVAGIYALMALGLNLQAGYSGC